MRRKPNLLVVAGGKYNTLKQMLRHYATNVAEIYVVNYYTINKSTEDSYYNIRKIAREFNAKIIDVREKIFNFILITEIYNKIKATKPDEWWIIADDDELQIYEKPIQEIIEDCEKNNWTFVRGGLIDKIGENGTFPDINEDDDLWNKFPLSAFFSEIISNAEQNKVTLMKGFVHLTTGQHFAYQPEEKVYPMDMNFTQIHHFKWDKNTINNLQDRISLGFHPIPEEANRFYKYLLRNDFKINLDRFYHTKHILSKDWLNIKSYLLDRNERMNKYKQIGFYLAENKNLAEEKYIDIGFDFLKNINYIDL